MSEDEEWISDPMTAEEVIQFLKGFNDADTVDT